MATHGVRVRVSTVAALVAMLVSCSGPAKVASTVTQLVGPSGGTIRGPGNAMVVIPAGALTASVSLTIATLPGATPPAGTAVVAVPLRLSPKAQTFALAATITIPIAQAQLPAGAAITDVIVLRGDDEVGAYVPVPSAASGPSVVVQTETLGDFIAVLPTVDGGTPFGTCANAVCDATETCATCPIDCGLCIGTGGTDGGLGADGSIDDAGVDDAGVDAGPPGPYVANADGTVTDTRTTLVWEGTRDASTHTSATAEAYCAALTLAGQTDWRVPAITELMRLTDYTVSPATDPAMTGLFQGPTCWSTTGYSPSASMYAWTVNFSSGQVSYSFRTTGWNVLCVRGVDSSQAAALVDNLDGTVTDTTSGRVWQQATDPTARLHADATTYCNSLTLPGGGWRLPTVVELQSLLRVDLPIPFIDGSAFPGTSVDHYWTSTPKLQAPGYFWMLDFDEGNHSWDSGSLFVHVVRCVR